MEPPDAPRPSHGGPLTEAATHDQLAALLGEALATQASTLSDLLRKEHLAITAAVMAVQETVLRIERRLSPSHPSEEAQMLNSEDVGRRSTGNLEPYLVNGLGRRTFEFYPDSEDGGRSIFQSQEQQGHPLAVPVGPPPQLPLAAHGGGNVQSVGTSRVSRGTAREGPGRRVRGELCPGTLAVQPSASASFFDAILVAGSTWSRQSSPFGEEEPSTSSVTSNVPDDGSSLEGRPSMRNVMTMDSLDTLVTDHLFASSGLTDERLAHGSRGRLPMVPARTLETAQQRQISEALASVVPVGNPSVAQGSLLRGAPIGAVTEDGQGCPFELDDIDSPMSRQVTQEAIMRTSTKRRTLDALRAEHDAMLILTHTPWYSELDKVGGAQMEQDSGLTDTWCCYGLISTFLLATFGMVPFRVGRVWELYRLALAAVLCSVLLVSVARAVQSSQGLYAHLSTACIALGDLLAVLFLRARGLRSFIGPHSKPLESYARSTGFLGDWRRMSMERGILVLMFWAWMAVSKFLGAALQCAGAPKSFLATGGSVLAYSILASLVYCQIHVCSAMELAIDNYCIKLFDSPDANTGITEWNLLQAMLRRAAHILEASFLSQGTTILGVTLLTILELFSQPRVDVRSVSPQCLASWAGWVLPPTAMVFYAVFRAASVTEKCLRVPALINSWVFSGQQIDHERSYVVQYIVNSSAGFYVKGVRVNSQIALKLFYTFGVLAFTVITQCVLRY